MSAIAAAQAGALIARVREEADRRTAELREATREQCAAIRLQARAEARARVKAAVVEKRRRVAEHCHAIDIENEATRRSSAFARDRELAARALAELPAALAVRWHDAAARNSWCAAAAAVASRVLRGREWLVELPPGATTATREFVAAVATEQGAQVRGWADCAAGAGLRIGHDGTWVDATAERLLADRTTLAARFLAELASTGDPP